MGDDYRGEITVGADKVSISGSAYEDLRPLVQGVVGVAAPLICVVANLSSLSADWANHKIDEIGQRYEEKLSKIPQEQRRLPPLEISASVVRNAAVSSDAPELQELFAELLVSASDTNRVNSAHPSFGTIIFELEPLDAKILALFRSIGRRSNLYPREIEREGGIGQRDKRLMVAISNLARLGLVAKETPDYARQLREIGGSHLSSGPEAEISALTEMISGMTKSSSEEVTSIYLTPFGERFVSACVQCSGGA